MKVSGGLRHLFSSVSEELANTYNLAITISIYGIVIMIIMADETKVRLHQITSRIKELNQELQHIHRQTQNPASTAKIKRKLENRATQIHNEANILINEFCELTDQPQQP